ncbi:carbon-nitrogen hydrolase family protein [Planctomicrobium sp. SH668]|uniref:carbon-nitrogen hydrolase family protein n=1 Tax=Planctomicrobium sp. SH668 TaxID=3448126 RepID=UPI003F5B95AA
MKIALVQMDVKIGENERNLSFMIERFRTARENSAELVIFPECALTGYCFDGIEEAAHYAESIPGKSTAAFQKVVSELGGYALFGMIEEDQGALYNVAVLLGATGIVTTYRKIHLPKLGVDVFATYGERPFEVVEIAGVRLGIGICYDCAFPESIRSLMLMGADLIALPTNFPSGAEGMVDHLIRTRGMENTVYFAACNRIGEERGFRFIGKTQVVDPSGKWIALASSDAEEILYADVDPLVARQKKIGRLPQKEALDRIGDRRPEMYGMVTNPHPAPGPDRDRPVIKKY